ncbi:MAG: virulence protein RhuM/Fic/DOC family protein [Candidatus Paceibacterota bacterium]|jgi:prophage maintenance system killer protein
MKSQKIKKEVVIYQSKSGAIELRGDFGKETVWATQAQIARAFDVDVRTVNEHIKNIYKTKELSESATIRNFRIVQKEGKREVERDVMHYNLDMILSTGYRVNSKKATAFRQWATKTLRSHIVDGYTINKSRIAQNYNGFLKAVADVKALLPKGAVMDTENILELITLFSDTWLSLDAYDKETLVTKGATKKSVKITTEMFTEALESLKSSLMVKGEATDFFATERVQGGVAGIVGNVMQGFGGKDMYPTVEEKAAHLLYFIIKNHPFIDGNKRSGAYAFIWFLSRANVLDTSRITPPALTAITLLVAESDPANKDRMLGLILTMLTRQNFSSKNLGGRARKWK